MEEWKEIAGFDGFYQISCQGEIRSVDRYVARKDGVTGFRKGCIKKQTEDKDGYLVVSLSKDGKTKKEKVHRLVAKAFINSCIDGFDIDHIDFNRKNNKVENLRVVSHIENILHTVSNCRNYTSRTDVSGFNNPNYGNKKLSKKYSENPELARLKQSRPGGSNGRSIPVRAVIDERYHSFECISYCAEWLISSGIVSMDKSYLSSIIRKNIDTGNPYCSILFYSN